MMAEEGQKRLGRGLAALMGDVKPASVIGSPVADGKGDGDSDRRVPIEQLKRNPGNPRTAFDPDALEDLANSIREKGILQPILVRPIGADDFEIVAGERRWRAAQKAGLVEVPIIIRELDDRDVLEIAIIENVQRADLNPMDEARGYMRLMDEFAYSHNDLAKVIGKSRSHVANMTRLMKLPESVRSLVEEGQLSMGHARALIGHDNAETLAKTVIAKGLSVRDTEKLVAKGTSDTTSGNPSRAASQAAVADPNIAALEKRLSNLLGLQAEIAPISAEKGSLKLHYSSLDQLEAVLVRLGLPN